MSPQTVTGNIALADPIEQREPKSGWRLFWISLPFFAAVVVLVAFAEAAGGFWPGLGYYLLAALAGGLWSLALIGNLVYSVARYGWGRSALALLAAVPAVSFLWLMGFMILTET